jgi:WD40 repeat protein
MAVIETLARIRVGSGTPVERLVCHPRPPLVAGFDPKDQTVHVWDCAAGQLYELGTVDAAPTPSDGADPGDDWMMPWDRWVMQAAWHPDQPLLLVAGKAAVFRWTPAGTSEHDGIPPSAGYRWLAFSPDGGTLWASPASSRPDDWHVSDVVDPHTGTIRTGRSWDTGVAVHPSGELVLTLASNQGATLGYFARVAPEVTPSAMRVLRKALILDVDGYETPIFSADGRHFAIRGNAYENILEIFAFPSLERVLVTTLGDPYPDDPYADDPYTLRWREQMEAWSRHNIAFGARPGVLWIGTPTGTVIELDIENQQAVEHDVLGGSPVSALAATANGDLVVAGDDEIVLLSVPGGSTPDRDAMQAMVTAFVEATSEVADDADLEDTLLVTDGTRSWEPEEIETVTTAANTDPTWLRLQAALNNVRNQHEGAKPHIT